MLFHQRISIAMGGGHPPRSECEPNPPPSPLIFFESKKKQKKIPPPNISLPNAPNVPIFFFHYEFVFSSTILAGFQTLKISQSGRCQPFAYFVAYICPSPISHRLLFSGLSIQNCSLQLVQSICQILLTMKTSQSYRKTSFKGFFEQKPFGTDQNGHKFQTTAIPDLHNDYKQYRQPINTIYITQIGL